MREKAYAKLNLTLDVLGQRTDGYHELRMVMQTVELADEVAVELGVGAIRAHTGAKERGMSSAMSGKGGPER